jgi:hypothetical protein
MAQQILVDQGLLIIDGSRLQSVRHTPVGGTPVGARTEISAWQDTTLARDRHPFPAGIRTRSPSKLVAADVRVMLRSRWDRFESRILYTICVTLSSYVGSEAIHYWFSAINKVHLEPRILCTACVLVVHRSWIYCSFAVTRLHFHPVLLSGSRRSKYHVP